MTKPRQANAGAYTLNRHTSQLYDRLLASAVLEEIGCYHRGQRQPLKHFIQSGTITHRVEGADFRVGIAFGRLVVEEEKEKSKPGLLYEKWKGENELDMNFGI